jgi:methyltransferase (TIGR00027 family)
MKKNQSSLTAAGIAFARAAETTKPPEARICDDPLARAFCGDLLYYVMRFFMITGYAERRGPGVFGFLVARCRYMDDVLRAHLQDGLEQLVILGAGYDSRAYRIAGVDSVQVFEVDHPATQREKVKKLEQILPEIPGNVRFVPVDFTAETLAKLFESGYRADRKTLFLWEGVTQYLTAEAVDSTLAFVARNASAGSVIVFDYMYSDLLDGSIRRGEVEQVKMYSTISGEQFRFGIDRGKAEVFMHARGYQQVRDVSQPDLLRMYFHGPNAGRKVADGYGIVSGVVKEPLLD